MSDKISLTEMLGNEEKWSIFSRLLETTEANEWIKLDEQFTVLAPTNDAFDRFPSGKLEELINEPNQVTLKLLLCYHFVPGKIHSEDLMSNPPRRAITGAELIFTDAAGLQVNGAKVMSHNLQASNGVIHEIDAVLVPPMQTAIKPVSPLEAAKTISAAPITLRIDTPPKNGFASRKPSTIF
jgi:uncharacterized surface protein with fasciclin (FAS1) repeats